MDKEIFNLELITHEVFSYLKATLLKLIKWVFDTVSGAAKILMIERKPKSAVLFKINTEAVTIEHLSYDSVQENGAIKEAAVTLNI